MDCLCRPTAIAITLSIMAVASAIADEPPADDVLKAAALRACKFDARSLSQSLAEREDLDNEAEAVAAIKDLIPEDYVSGFQEFATSADAALLVRFAKDSVADKRFDGASCQFMAPLAVALTSAGNLASYGLKIETDLLLVPPDVLYAIRERCDAASAGLPIAPICDFPG